LLEHSAISSAGRARATSRPAAGSYGPPGEWEGPRSAADRLRRLHGDPQDRRRPRRL